MLLVKLSFCDYYCYNMMFGILHTPTGYDRTFNWNSYLSTCKATRAPEGSFTKQQMAKVIYFPVASSFMFTVKLYIAKAQCWCCIILQGSFSWFKFTVSCWNET